MMKIPHLLNALRQVILSMAKVTHIAKHCGMHYQRTGINMISLTNATVEYQEKTLSLPNISLHKGEILGLNGVSGSGKSTLAMILAGFIKPKTGELNVPVYGKKHLTLFNGLVNILNWLLTLNGTYLNH